MPEYIERNMAIKSLQLEVLGEADRFGIEKAILACAQKQLFNLPAADVAPVVHGRWVNVVCDGYAGEHSGECSHCGERNTFRLPERAHFCSFCGAKMDLEDPQP